MPLTRDEVLANMESAYQAFRHELRDLNYSLDWKRDFNDPNAWSPRDIATHLIGTLERNTLRTLALLLEQGAATVQLEGDNPYRETATRAMTLQQLTGYLDEMQQKVVSAVRSATDAQLAAIARIPRADGTVRELTFLEVINRAFTAHWPEHTKQLHAIREELGVAEL
jgi:hypothetical protein